MVKSTRWPASDKAALKTWFEDGLDDEQIGNKIGRSEDAVREMRSKLGYVKYTKEPYTQKNPREKTTRSGKKVLNGAALQLFDIGKALNQPSQKVLIMKMQKPSNEITIKQDFQSRETATGTINIDATGCGVQVIVTGLAPQQAARILLEFISKIV